MLQLSIESINYRISKKRIPVSIFHFSQPACAFKRAILIYSILRARIYLSQQTKSYLVVLRPMDFWRAFM